MEPITTVILSIISALISAIIATKLSLIRFRSEKWWEKKYDIYLSVIESFYNAHLFSDKHLEAQYEERELSKEEKDNLMEVTNLAQNNIKRIKFLGSFFLSGEASECLSEYIYKSEHTEEITFWFDYLTYDSEVTNKCFNDFVVIAKSDLGIESLNAFSKILERINKKGVARNFPPS